jgi:hypothetical protein
MRGIVHCVREHAVGNHMPYSAMSVEEREAERVIGV